MSQVTRGLKKPHAAAGLHAAVQGAFAVALAVITLQHQLGDAITLWLDCTLTVTRHRCEEGLPGKWGLKRRIGAISFSKGSLPA